MVTLADHQRLGFFWGLVAVAAIMSVLCFLAAYLHRIGQQSMGPISIKLRRLSALSPELLCGGQSDLCDVPANKVVSAIAVATMNIDTKNANAPQISLELWSQASSRAIEFHDGICNGEMKLRRKPCVSLEAGHVQERLTSIVDFLDANPDEVIIVSTPLRNEQSWTEEFSLNEIVSAYQAVPEFNENTVYLEAGGTEAWPTLRELIADGKRIVLILDEAFEESSCGRLPCMGEHSLN